MAGAVVAVPLAGAGANRAALVERVLSGGFPDVVARREEHDREPWLRAYVTSVVQRDLRERERRHAGRAVRRL